MRPVFPLVPPVIIYLNCQLAWSEELDWRRVKHTSMYINSQKFGSYSLKHFSRPQSIVTYGAVLCKRCPELPPASENLRLLTTPHSCTVCFFASPSSVAVGYLCVIISRIFFWIQLISSFLWFLGEKVRLFIMVGVSPQQSLPSSSPDSFRKIGYTQVGCDS